MSCLKFVKNNTFYHLHICFIWNIHQTDSKSDSLQETVQILKIYLLLFLAAKTQLNKS